MSEAGKTVQATEMRLSELTPEEKDVVDVLLGLREQQPQIPTPPAQPMPSVPNGDQPDFRNPPGTSENDLHPNNEHYVTPHKKQKMDNDKFANRWSQPSTAAGSSGNFNATASSSSTSAPSLSAVNQRKMATDGVASSSQRSSTPNTSSNSAQKRPALGTSTGTPNVMNNAAADPQVAAPNALRQLSPAVLRYLLQNSGAQMMACYRTNFVPHFAAPNASGQQQPLAQQSQMMPDGTGYFICLPGLPNATTAPPAQIGQPQQGSSGNAATSAVASNTVTGELLNPMMSQCFQKFMQKLDEIISKK